MDPLRKALIRYGTWLLAKQLGQEFSRDGPWSPLVADADFRTDGRIARARTMLGDWSDEVSGPAEPGRLQSIFTFVRYDQRWDETKNRRVDPYDMPRRVLDIDLTQADDQAADKLWEEFEEQVSRLGPGWGLFETFTALMTRYGWYVPGTLQDEAVSVYEQFKAVSALAHVLEPDENDVLLVAGDLPGIQDVLYTITSAGVAKALRGRSFYLQLVNDAIVRALLRNLALPSSCVVYNAGGNFQLLVPINNEDELITLRMDSDLFDNVRISVDVKRPAKPETVVNELDVIVTRRGRLAAISCKTGTEMAPGGGNTAQEKRKQAVYELDSLLQADLMGLYARKLLISNRVELAPAIRSRASHSQIRCVSGGELPNVAGIIEDHLKT